MGIIHQVIYSLLNAVGVKHQLIYSLLNARGVKHQVIYSLLKAVGVKHQVTYSFLNSGSQHSFRLSFTDHSSRTATQTKDWVAMMCSRRQSLHPPLFFSKGLRMYLSRSCYTLLHSRCNNSTKGTSSNLYWHVGRVTVGDCGLCCMLSSCDVFPTMINSLCLLTPQHLALQKLIKYLLIIYSLARWQSLQAVKSPSLCSLCT